MQETRLSGEPLFDAPQNAFESGPGLLEALTRFRWLVVSAGAGAAIVVFGLSSLQAASYDAEATMLLSDPRTSAVFDPSSSSISDRPRYVRNQADFVESAAVAVRAAEINGGETSATDIRDSVTAVPARDLDLITIRVSGPRAEGAADLANAVGNAYQQLVSERVQQTASDAIAELVSSKAELKIRVHSLDAALQADPGNGAIRAERDSVVAQLFNLDTRISQIDLDMALYGSGVEYFEVADIPTSPASPRPLRNGAAAAVIGLLAAAVFAWWWTERAPLAERRHDPAPILGAPLIGEVPDFAAAGAKGPAPVIHEPDSMAAEAYHFLASSVAMALERVGGLTVLITSASAGDGKTVTSLNLAAAASGNGKRVLVVDGDERARGLTRMGGDDSLPGLADLVHNNDLTLLDCLVRWRVADGRYITVLPSGQRSSAAGSGHATAYGSIMDEIKAAAGFVVVDSPPILAAAESIDLAAHADGVVLVVEQGTSLAALADVRTRLDVARTPLLGYVFNRATRRALDEKYAYGYGRT